MHTKLLTCLLLLSATFVILAACTKGTDPTPVSVPVLTTTVVTGITTSSAVSGGNITSDGGSAVTARGICWSTNATPTIADSRTTDGTGTGSFSSSITGLTLNTRYYVRAYATNSNGTGYGNTVTFTSAVLSENTVTDIDGNVYRTVRIGNQVWMAENLKTTKYRNGDAIANVKEINSWNNLTSGAYCNYNNDENIASTYGRLYNWYAVSDNRSIAPEGWHVPSDEEWSTLINYLGGPTVAGTKLKSTNGWSSGGNGTDNYSFTALPGGARNYMGAFEYVEYCGLWWTSTVSNSSEVKSRYIEYTLPNVNSSMDSKSYGLSVRCVKD